MTGIPALESDTRSSVVENPWRWLLLVGTPVLLGVSFLVHPDGSGGLDTLPPVGDTWLFLHVAMLPLLGLLGVSLYVLLDDYTDPVATIGRIGVAIYLTFYIAFEAIAGIATGLLTREARRLPVEQQEGVAAAIDALVAPSVALGIVGTVGALVAVVSIGILLRRSGAPLVPLFLLGGAPLATVFHSGTPIDTIAMMAFLAGIVWLELHWRRGGDRQARGKTETERSVERT